MCAAERVKKWKAKNKNHMIEYRRKYRDENKEHIKTKLSEWRANNKESLKTRLKQWHSDNPSLRNSITAKRRAAKMKRTPTWADLKEIKKWYEMAREQNLQVDHIVPLQGKLVSGLHVAGNLQLLSRHENCKKHNYYKVI